MHLADLTLPNRYQLHLPLEFEYDYYCPSTKPETPFFGRYTSFALNNSGCALAYQAEQGPADPRDAIKIAREQLARPAVFVSLLLRAGESSDRAVGYVTAIPDSPPEICLSEKILYFDPLDGFPVGMLPEKKRVEKVFGTDAVPELTPDQCTALAALVDSQTPKLMDEDF